MSRRTVSQSDGALSQLLAKGWAQMRESRTLGSAPLAGRNHGVSAPQGLRDTALGSRRVQPDSEPSDAFGGIDASGAGDYLPTGGDRL